MKVLILGMGNPILSDDGVGLAVAERLRELISGADVVSETMIGLGLLERIAGYDRIYVIDAMIAPNPNVGKIRKITPEGKEGTRHLFSSHGLNFFELMELGARLGQRMPEVGAVYGIEIWPEVAFGEELSPPLQEKLAALTEAIARDILSQTPSLSVDGKSPLS